MIVKREKVNLDHEVWKFIKQEGLQGKRILLAVSGGLDSTALAAVLARLHKKSHLGICYFHHGEDSNQDYRKEAQSFVEKLARTLELPFYPLKSTQLAKTEAQYRELRYAALSQLMQEQGYDCLATGHHRDDLLETRVLRLIRGTGAQGLQAMHVYKDQIFRPFLETSKKELKQYLRSVKLRELSDPSNESLDPMRNWLREDWFKALEKRKKGSLESLARSLETLAKDLDPIRWGELLEKNEAFNTQGLSRAFYLTLTPIEQKRLLAQYLFALGKRDFSQAHLEEIQKRLDKPQKVITFKVGGFHWEINAEQIKVQS